ncbi:heparinase II/III-family protein [Alphaproteobacteria bacterium]|nr:heparinase II/III-family protein [Alphaproteobacteria bacterium]
MLYKFKKKPKLSSLNGIKVNIPPGQISSPMFSKNGLLKQDHYTLFGKIYYFRKENFLDDIALIEYHKQYFDVLRYENIEEFNKQAERLMDKWIDLNGKVGSGLQPYVTSLRLVNWIKYFLINKNKKKKYHISAAQQFEVLSCNIEYHLLGNHILANYKALIICRLFFDEKFLPKIKFEKLLNLFLNELDRQVTRGGAHFELSLSYQSIIIEDILDIVNFMIAYDRVQRVPELLHFVNKLLDHLKLLLHPDGKITFFNDSNFSNASAFTNLLAYYEKLKERFFEKKIIITDSGIHKISIENSSLYVNFSNVLASYIPGHTHAEALSFELSLNNKRVFVNSGVSEYGTSKLRLYQRGTSAHNCLTINNKNSSEIWHGFRLGKRARVDNFQYRILPNGAFLKASHNGFEKFPEKVNYSREFQLIERSLSITDIIEVKKKISVQRHLHLHPLVDTEIIKHNRIKLFCTLSKEIIGFIDTDKTSIEIYNGTWNPEFYNSKNNKNIILKNSVSYPSKLKFRIYW